MSDNYVGSHERVEIAKGEEGHGKGCGEGNDCIIGVGATAWVKYSE